jgi:uncharacterized protein with FMN-binding domain
VRRPVIVAVATAAGLLAVLSFHTKPNRLTLGATPNATVIRPPTTTTVAAGPPPPSGTTTAPPPTTTPPVATRSARGASVNYNFGVLAVSVTVTGSKITHVTIASLDDGGDPTSQSIDQQSVPLLERQAIEAQSANIQGVSGASFTSAGFDQSLQSALSQLGLK